MALTNLDNSALTGEEIQAVQRRLDKLGFDPGPIDSLLGPHTISAILAFKRFAGLRVRPYIGPKTWEKLHQEYLKLTEQPRSNLMAYDTPPWMIEISQMMNSHEIYDNVGLSRWLASDGNTLGDPAELPWCGDAVETAIRLALPKEIVPKNPYWALNWQKWGLTTSPTYGCIISIKRPKGGHVAFLVGQDKNRYYCLGGNQSNQIRVSPINKSRFTKRSFRWPVSYERERIYLPVMTSIETASINEA